MRLIDPPWPPWPATIGVGESRCRPYERTKALMLAILQGAIRAYHGPDMQQRAEVVFWMADRQA
jgi:hypothetical protein